MKIVIVGTGYVGLVTGTCFAEVGIDVTCVDVDVKKIENLKKGISPIYEPGLDEMIVKNMEKGRLSFSTKLSEVLDGASVVFSAVGTPPDEDGSADLKYVLNVAKEVGENINNYCLVVTKSTVPVGTAEKVKKTIKEALEKRGKNIEFDVASNPEFLKEGSAVKDFLYPDRIVVGTDSEKAQEIMSRLYKPFTLNGHQLIHMDVPSAEMTKYAANSMLAVRISFMNEIANLCERVGANVNMVRKGIGTDTRIGQKFLYSGIGYGGSCFPKDVKALYKTGQENGIELKVIKAAEDANSDQKLVLFNKLKNIYPDLKGKTIALWGLSFKPETDDMREAPSLYIIEALSKQGCIIKAYDPIAMEETKRRLPNCDITFTENEYDAVEGADALLLLTEWKEFRIPKWKEVKERMNSLVILDGRNIYEPNDLRQLGFYYEGIGIK
ncbi:MAG: UDP-glucose/GDP-mannose dehydrogenase family protein [Bacteroidales bacterium]|jgi:UDPglucose 6-dehydrogenase|nr:UDP-glucose/GDP-mannose dehydrogenase family protein [Bacteroidales bacterium]